MFSFLLLVVCVIGLFLGHSKFHRLRRKLVLGNEHYARLLELAERSLQSSDIPVGALLFYKGSIIGEGFNTVLRNGKAGEHAEINAVSEAISEFGMDKFASLERDSLVLVTTFEPCLMCAGAFVNYSIQNVHFMKEKDLSYTAKEEGLFVRYLLRRKQIRHRNEQDTLFEKHPDYPGRKK